MLPAHATPQRTGSDAHPIAPPLAHEHARAFASHAGLDPGDARLTLALCELIAALARTRAGAEAERWEALPPGALAAALVEAAPDARATLFGLAWGLFQFLSTTGRIELCRGRYFAAYFQTLTELADPAVSSDPQLARLNASNTPPSQGFSSGRAGTFGGEDCPFTNDGECDEPDFCPVGTDTADCS